MIQIPPKEDNPSFEDFFSVNSYETALSVARERCGRELLDELDLILLAAERIKGTTTFAERGYR